MDETASRLSSGFPPFLPFSELAQPPICNLLRPAGMSTRDVHMSDAVSPEKPDGTDLRIFLLLEERYQRAMAADISHTDARASRDSKHLSQNVSSAEKEIAAELRACEEAIRTFMRCLASPSKRKDLLERTGKQLDTLKEGQSFVTGSLPLEYRSRSRCLKILMNLIDSSIKAGSPDVSAQVSACVLVS